MLFPLRIAGVLLSLLPIVALSACDKSKDDTTAKAEAPAEKTASPGKAEAAESAESADGKAAAQTVTVADGARVEIDVDATGYHPAQIQAPAGAKLTLAFTRSTEAGCGQKLVIAAMEVERELPLGEAVDIEVQVPASGELGFACGMDMYRGKVVPRS